MYSQRLHKLWNPRFTKLSIVLLYLQENLSLRKPCNTGFIQEVSLQCVASNDTCSVFMFSLRKPVQFCTKCDSIDTAIIFKCSHFLLFWILSCLFFCSSLCVFILVVYTEHDFLIILRSYLCTTLEELCCVLEFCFS